MIDIPKEFYFLKTPDESVEWFLMASYVYYLKYSQIMPDYTFDKMCRWMLNNWESIKHPYKSLIDEEDLSCGSGYGIREDQYPKELKERAEKLIR